MKNTLVAKEKVGILGFGEVGKAIARFYKNPKIKDLKRDDGLEGSTIFHVCIPWNGKFLNIVKEEIEKIKPKLTIIHSTVAPGTTRNLNAMLPKGLAGTVVHSPIRGDHPYLYRGVKLFLKYIGADDKKIALFAQKHLCGLGMKIKIFYPSATTELGKLFDTTYYGLCIAWHGEMKKICDKEGVDFAEAIQDFNRTYNEGYKKLKKEHVVRPVLYAPNPLIGGHCVIPNVKILKQFYQSKAFDLILEYGQKENQE
ncbi:MAG: hypothetical protein HYW95_03085 [Candidatus Wildermuthbacteria bacterium]|nr:hypothetical protein [Candidatus Wildermuthbacteria bacterium]